MRVLWFEVTVPSQYKSHGFYGAGWQDSLENIVKVHPEIDLGIAFESPSINDKSCVIDNVHYFPLTSSYSIIEKIKDKYTWEISRNKLIPLSLQVIEDFKPDVIHVFGSEWCFGQVAEFTNIPVVIHLQGSIPPYNNAFYPPGYSFWTEYLYSITHLKLKSLLTLPLASLKRVTWKHQEEKTLSLVNNYMGRTDWDKSVINLYNPKANYFYCSEALRPSFINSAKSWTPTENKILRLTTTGCSSLWKGLDTIVRVAKLLKDRNIEFEWCLAGKINYKELIEWKERIQMHSVNVRIMGMLNAEDLSDLLIKTDIYIHPAYIDNSPNSICEAQYLGLPIIATYVGGIPSLIENKIDGLLVPANAPYDLANEIINLSKDNNRQIMYSTNSRKKAIERHNPENIYKDLIYVYNTIL